MSFEFKGAIIARDLILKLDGPEDQADSICDAIIRHQDIFVKGYVLNLLSLLCLIDMMFQWEYHNDWSNSAVGHYPW
jgi:hypothetical protein